MSKTATPLYPTEDTIAVLALGKRAKEWPKLAPVLEREGMPRIDPLLGARYWPAVRAFLDSRHGIRLHAPPGAVNGQEDFDDD